jgi:hypothetical protein
MLFQSTKNQTLPVEQHATSINPRMIVSWKRPDQLFTEVRLKKLEEL